MNRRQVLEMAAALGAAGALLAAAPTYGQASGRAAQSSPPKASPKARQTSNKPVRPATGAEMADRIVEAVLVRLDAAGDAHWHKGEYNHIINLYKMTIAADPHDLDAYSNAGWLLWSLDKDAEAVALYNQGLKANPGSYYMYDELGQYYAVRKKNWAKALSYYQRAAGMKDCQPQSIHMLAHAYEHTGDLAKAEAAWQRAIEMPNNTNVGAAKANLSRVRALRKSKGV